MLPRGHGPLGIRPIKGHKGPRGAVGAPGPPGPTPTAILLSAVNVNGTTCPAGVQTPILFTLVEFSNGITISTPSADAVVGTTGTYTYNFSLQLKSSAGNTDAVVWLEVNGISHPYSSSYIHVKSADYTIITLVYLLALNAGDAVRIVLQPTTQTVLCQTVPAAPGAPQPIPAGPGVVLNMFKLS